MKKIIALFAVTTLASTCALAGVALSGSSSVSDGDTIYEYYDNGQIKYEGNYKDDKVDGKWTWWYENGQKELESNYKDGKRDGKWTWWYENGQKECEGEYEDGHEVGNWIWWDENGKIISESYHQQVFQHLLTGD